jgi:hypothetical protein
MKLILVALLLLSCERRLPGEEKCRRCHAECGWHTSHAVNPREGFTVCVETNCYHVCPGADADGGGR